MPRFRSFSPTMSRRQFLAGSTLAPLLPRTLAARQPGAAGSVVIETALGRIQGVQEDGYAVFQGVPYAKPPVDDLRWVAPQPVEPWGNDVLVAEEPGPVAPQAQMPFLDERESSEDCLYLNVWVPGTPEEGAGKPVIVFVHGGANLFGSGSEYLASRMAADEDVVVVTINYRMGIFGSFVFPGLPDGGTFGLLDQVMALEWVRDHIEAFGGDPGNVTLMGQSWGGLCVSAHLVSPLSEGLFHRAVIQSGVALADFPAGTMFGLPAIHSLWATEDERTPVSQSVIEDLRIDETKDIIGALRKVPTGLLNAFSALYVPYVWGTRFLPEHPVDATLAGEIHPVPVLAGSTRDEARLMVTLSGGFLARMGEDEYLERLEDAFGDEAIEIASEYPFEAFPSGELAWATVVTDRVWARPTMEQHRALAAVTPVWAYEFRDREAPAGFLAVGGDDGAGAYHSAELGYQFDVREPAPLAASQRRLAAMMNRYWATFARDGDPNGEGLPRWEPFDSGETVLGLDDGPGEVAPVDFAVEHRLAFWEGRGEILAGED